VNGGSGVSAAFWVNACTRAEKRAAAAERRAMKAEQERDALAAEVDRLRGVVDRCPADDTPLLHDDDDPQLKWWCPECGLITDRPSLIEEAPDA
jgi:hypothetical protein